MVRSKTVSLRTICQETLTHTSAHGVSSILRSTSKPQKNCWIVFVVVVVICMLWQCSELISTFFHYPSQEKVTLVNSARLKFPAVTFCNLNRVRKSFMQSKLRFLKEELQFLNDDYDGANLTQSQEAYIQDSNRLGFALSRLNLEEQAEAGHQLGDMLISCHFHGEKCDKSFFNAFLNHKFGNCYTFNSLTKMEKRGRLMRRDVLNATKAGFSYGLTMELSIEQDEYIEHISQAAGIRLIIHDQKDMPFPEDDGVNISPGQESDLAIIKVHVHRLKDPYHSKCTDGDNIHNYYRDVFKVGYTREDEFARKLRRSGGKLAKVADKIRDNLIKVVINYQQLNYELIEEIPSFQVIDLLSSVGGLVGLWIGVSICTVAEFLELFLKVIIFSITKVVRKSQHTPLNPYMIAHQTYKSNV
ncbi:acid-sensing ion channel 1-like [Amia ocellicauda]|uniref:acid-sensing ion channel 1-like n=1 Tax=Amia ocellicauda TaxID=2972642 RepID=UPI00346472DC